MRFFSAREKNDVFSLMKFYFTPQWTLNDQWNLFGSVASEVKNWFELVLEGEELEDQASTQEAEKFNVCTLCWQKIKNSGPLFSW